jgi:hypothetical protein
MGKNYVPLPKYWALFILFKRCTTIYEKSLKTSWQRVYIPYCTLAGFIAVWAISGLLVVVDLVSGTPPGTFFARVMPAHSCTQRFMTASIFGHFVDWITMGSC